MRPGALRLGAAIALALSTTIPTARADAAAPTVPTAPVDPPAGAAGEAVVKPPMAPGPVPNPSPVVLGGVATPEGTTAKPLEWKRARFSTADFVILLAGGATTLAAAIVQPQPEHFYGPVLFDDTVRDHLRAPTLQTRYTFRDASDVGLSLAATWPFFVDALISAWWLRGSRDVAEQMALLGLETLAVSGAIQGTTNMLVSRERPYGDSCGKSLPGELPNNAIDCTSSSHYRSFFSGHSAFSFTSAALICFEHTELELLGPPWDALSCVGGYAVAATTATFRVVGDVHYASDILTGALVGSLVGWGVPLLHFRRPDVGTVKSGSLKMRIVPSAGGAGVVGTF